MPGSTIPVWDRFVRVAHWLLALSILFAWLTREGWGRWHEWIGYVSLAVVAARIAWGMWGPGNARFAAFVRRPAITWRYAREVLRAREPRHIGHNPLGAWMIVALLVTVILVGATGWLYTTDRFWGVAWVERLHSILADALLVLVGLHVAGVLFASLRHRENLVWSMFSGRKRAPETD